MFSYSSCVFLCLGLFLVTSNAQKGVKSPYRKSDDLNNSGEKVDHSGEFRDYSRTSLDQIKENITQISIDYKSLKQILDSHVQYVHDALENRCNVSPDLGHYPADRGPYGGGSSGGRGQPSGQGSGGIPGGRGQPSGQGSGRIPGGSGSRPSYPTSFTRPPRIRNVDEFDLAICNLRPNSKTRSNVTGIVLLQQKRNSPTLYMYIRAHGFDVSGHGGHGDHERTGPLTDNQKVERLQDIAQTRQDFSQQLSKMAKNQKVIDNGHSHAFRVHDRSDISGGCGATGAIYNPQNLKPGVKHLGDFGNIECDEEGVTSLLITDETASLRGQYSIVGKPLVIHSSPSDYSSNINDEDDCLSCCIIEKIPSNLYNEYQFPIDSTFGQIGSNCDYTSESGHYHTHGHYVSGVSRGSSQTEHHHHHHHGSGVYPGGSGSGGYPGGSGSGGYPVGSGSGGYPGGSGVYYRPGSGTRPSGSVRPGGQGGQGGHGGHGGHGSHQPINQGGHDTGAEHIDVDEELSQKPTDYKRGKNPYQL